ncbi:MAG TPA: magnesium transporter [Candidatus Faeciplasma gallinarum]|uniref:Magnesium transporter MgtE n=1 Tax=Candidatus Faeciplasma gallinarum TaxID=2840799 RepID=A0A9D1EMU7_9FIRM|nr:magnesium transporter [Candidatus Faeciplasma gallinarum]
MEKTTVFDIVIKLLEQHKFAELKLIMNQMNPTDIASIFDEADKKDVPVLFRLLPKELAAQTFAYLDSDQQEQLILAFSDKEIRDMVDELFLDDTVDIIEEMPANVVSRILKNTDEATRRQINELLAYPDDSAGSVMTPEFVYLNKNMTVLEAFDKIRSVGVAKETIYTCYVTEERKLIGVVSLLDLVTAPQNTKVEQIMDENVISVNTKEDKETVAATFAKYDLLALPVVDGENRLVGIVTVDDAIDVMQDENTEDIELMAAIVPTDKPYFKTSVFETFLKRIPWLLILMVSATFTGMIITGFEEKLAASVALTAFIPMLMDTGGNAGGQSSTTIIRGLSLGNIQLKDVLKVLWKEMRVAVLCGVVLAVVNFVKIMLVDRLLLGNSDINAMVALVVCLTLVVAVFIAKIIGCTLPIGAKVIGFDPAVMASPFITTIVDAISLLSYFWIAQALLGI